MKTCDKCNRFFLFMRLRKVEEAGEILNLCDVCFDPNIRDKRFHSVRYVR